MTDRRVNRRRLAAWLMVALLGPLAVVTPAQAAATCTGDVQGHPVADPGRSGPVAGRRDVDQHRLGAVDRLAGLHRLSLFRGRDHSSILERHAVVEVSMGARELEQRHLRRAGPLISGTKSARPPGMCRRCPRPARASSIHDRHWRCLRRSASLRVSAWTVRSRSSHSGFSAFEGVDLIAW